MASGTRALRGGLRRVRSHASMLTASLSLLALVATLLTAGRSYFYCAEMERAALAPCCDHGHDGVDAARVASVIDEATPPCCEARPFAASASFVRAEASPPIAAPLVAIAPPRTELLPLLPPLIARPTSGPIRAGPPPALARAVLQVWHS